MYLSNNVLNLHLRNGVSFHGGGKLRGIFCQYFVDQLVIGILGLLFQNDKIPKVVLIMVVL